MTNKKKRIVIVFSIFLISLLIWLGIRLMPNTPAGVELAPLLEIQFNDTNSNLDYLQVLIPESVNFRQVDDHRRINISSPYTEPPHVFSSTDLYEFNSNKAALDEFNSYIRIFTDESRSWKLFEKHLETNNNWFSSYKTTS